MNYVAASVVLCLAVFTVAGCALSTGATNHAQSGCFWLKPSGASESVQQCVASTSSVATAAGVPASNPPTIDARPPRPAQTGCFWLRENGTWQETCRQREAPHVDVPDQPLLPVASPGNVLHETVRVGKIGMRDAVTVTGPIGLEDDQEFFRSAARLTDPIVVLSSPGGSTRAAINIGKFLRLRALDTLVPEGQSCMSACGLIWLAGRTRYMGSTSQVGFHASYLMKGGEAVESGVANAIVGAYLANLGLPDRVVVYVTQAPPDQINLLTRSDARSLGIQVSVLPGH